MSTKPSDCQAGLLEELVNGRLGEAATRQLEAHLADCVACRQWLDEAIASRDTWNEVRTSLAGDSCDSSQSAFGDATSSSLTTDLCSSTDLAFYRRLLVPSDDPAMLGRIANYEIVGLLGHGGMGIVFKAFDGPLNRYVALKMMAPQFASNGTAKQRFLREARAAAAVAHEHVIAIHGVAAWQETPYLVMAYIGGVSLQQRLAKTGPLQLREVLRIGMQVASGLAAAHEQGLIHRDVKPANILMEAGIDRVVLTDFGLARAVDDIRLTQSDTLLGTPQYMSPEQARDAEIDCRTDLFSLGSVMYEAISGRPAFHAATSYGVLRKIVDHTPPPLHQIVPDVPIWFERIVARLMSKEPCDRFSEAAEIERLLKHCLAHLEHPASVALPTELAAPSTVRFSLIPRGMVMSLVIGSVLLGIAAILLAPPAPQQHLSAGADNKVAPTQQLKKSDVPVLVAAPALQDANKTQYKSAEEAYSVGVAYYNSRNYKSSRAPLEAAARMADNEALRLKAYQALLPAYREIPEFEPFQKAAEYIIAHSPQSAERSLTRRAFLAFAHNRGQLDNLFKRYEQILSKDKNNYMAVYILSEIASSNEEHAKRSIELLKQLEKLEAKRNPAPANAQQSDADKAKMAIEKGKLAQQYVKSREFRKGARLYEEIAPLNSTTQAWHLKEAASAWLKDGNKKEAARLADEADSATPESRNDQLEHFFHRNLADIFMQLDQPKKAVPHYEIAIKKTTIEGYLKDTKASLNEAKEKSE